MHELQCSTGPQSWIGACAALTRMDAVIVLCGSSASRDMAKWQREVEAADTAGTGVRATSLTAETFHGLSGECWHLPESNNAVR